MSTEIIPGPLKTMRDITGTLETAGSADNPVILSWADEIAKKFPEMKLYCAQYQHDSIPWCGLTVGYVMAHNGIKPIFGPTDTDKFLWARAWEQFGTKVDEPKPGDVLVFPGHVSMFDGQEGDYYLCRGGNQSDSVKISKYPTSSVIAIRRPPYSASDPVVTKPIPISKDKTQMRYTNIIATVFGGQTDPNTSAYDNHEIDDDELGVALPARFEGDRPKVRVFSADKAVDCDIVDVGPWNTKDRYWETNSRPQAESGEDLTGRTTNKAGIDLTPAAAFALGINGKGTVDWMFIPAQKINTKKEEQVVRDSSKKMRLFDNIRMTMKAIVLAVSGLFTTDSFGWLNTWLGIGNGAIPITTLFTIALAGIGVWVLVNVLDTMSMDDFKAGRWMPSELAKDNPILKAVEDPASSTPIAVPVEEVPNAFPANPAQ